MSACISPQAVLNSSFFNSSTHSDLMETSLLQEIQEQTVDAASQFDSALFDFSGDTEAMEAIFEETVTLPPQVAVGEDNPEVGQLNGGKSVVETETMQTAQCDAEQPKRPNSSGDHTSTAAAEATHRVTRDWGKFEPAKASENAPQSETTKLSDDDCILVGVRKIRHADSEGPKSRREKRMKKKKNKARVWKGNGIVHEYLVGEGKAIVQLSCDYCAMGIIHSASKHKGQLMSVRMKLKDVPAGTSIRFDSHDGEEQLDDKRKTRNTSPIYTGHPLMRRKGAIRQQNTE